MQALYLLGLDPIAETLADGHSYGFRLERCCADAVDECHKILRGHNGRDSRGPDWVFEGDIKSCYDRIGHGWLLDHLFMDKEVLGKWLKAGYLEKQVLFATTEGTPQGGIISPALANWALDGLQRLLADHFARRYAAKNQKPVRGFSKEAMEIVQNYAWPGNVRELEHVIERGVIVAEGPQVRVEDLSLNVKSADRPASPAAFTIPPHHTLAEIEKLAILQTLERTSWNKRRAASILGVYRPTLYSKLRKYQLADHPDGASRAASRAKTARG